MIQRKHWCCQDRLNLKSDKIHVWQSSRIQTHPQAMVQDGNYAVTGTQEHMITSSLLRWLQWWWCHHALLRNSIHKNLQDETLLIVIQILAWVGKCTALKVLQNPCKCCIWPQIALKLPYKEVTELWGVARILYTGSMLSMKMTIYTHLKSELPWYRVRCVSLDRMLLLFSHKGINFSYSQH